MECNLKSRIEASGENHKKGYNCAQCVLCAYADHLGTPEEMLFGVSEGFGVGMGGLMGTCGAVTAMFMAAGLHNSCSDPSACNTTPATMRLVRELAAEFEKKNGSLICRELKGVDTGKPLRSCDGCIEDAIRILGEKVFGLS